MARPLSPAKREEIAHEAYRLSTRGKSSREVARILGVSHTTVQAHVRSEIARRRENRPDFQQSLIDAHMQVLDRLWEELDRNPTSHAVAQLSHACNAALASLAALTGANPPRRSEADIHHHTQEAWSRGFETLSGPELAAFMLLLGKVEGKVAAAADVVSEIVRQYQSGTLVLEDNIVEIHPAELEEEDC